MLGVYNRSQKWCRLRRMIRIVFFFHKIALGIGQSEYHHANYGGSSDDVTSTLLKILGFNWFREDVWIWVTFMGCWTSKLDMRMGEGLEAPVLEEEFFDELMSIYDSKASIWVDSYSNLLKCFCGVFQVNFVSPLVSFLRQHSSTYDFQPCLFCLSPRLSVMSVWKTWPIFLLGWDHNFVARVLIVTLWDVMGTVIGGSQLVFICDWNIFYGWILSKTYMIVFTRVFLGSSWIQCILASNGFSGSKDMFPFFFLFMNGSPSLVRNLW